ncbi:MAG TPA: M15 family metallopeptidase [Lysobacter sp.]|nr:M15 family metallopeptidase [Lysobacter sp.]
MHARPQVLLNTPEIELWPAWLLAARRNADARALAQARWLLRRKRDGRYLATLGADGLRTLLPRPPHRDAVGAALARLDGEVARPLPRSEPARPLPLQRLQQRLHLLGLDDGYGARTGLPLVPEPDRLAFAGFDRYRRPLWLLAPAARAWTRMQDAARRDGVVLEAISGYRSHDYQLGIFERKRARGLSVEQILTVNAAPGYSEHHSGRALDIGTPGEPPAEESFERTGAFAWLRAHADAFGFVMSYPRDNPHGIVYEPWHWCWRAA